MKRFYSLDPKHLEGLSFWFWFRENLSYINDTLVNMLSDFWHYPPSPFRNYDEWLTFILIPVGYCVAFVVGPWMRKKEAFRDAQPEYEVVFYNKKNIEYLTILHTLSGGYDNNSITTE